jgi:hypothetical protein
MAGRAAARRAGEQWGAAVLRGAALPVPMPAVRRTWFARVLGR